MTLSERRGDVGQGAKSATSRLLSLHLPLSAMVRTRVCSCVHVCVCAYACACERMNVRARICVCMV